MYERGTEKREDSIPVIKSLSYKADAMCYNSLNIHVLLKAQTMKVAGGILHLYC